MFCDRLSPVYTKPSPKKQTKKILNIKKNIKYIKTKHKSKQSVIICIIIAIIPNKIAIIKLDIVANGSVCGEFETESPNRSTQVPCETSKTMACIYVSVKIFVCFCFV